MDIHDLIENKRATNAHPSDALHHVDHRCEGDDSAPHDDDGGWRDDGAYYGQYGAQYHSDDVQDVYYRVLGCEPKHARVAVYVL
jgi:hypothetical protein